MNCHPLLLRLLHERSQQFDGLLRGICGEIDILEHVNTAIYLEWFAQAWSDATGQLPSQVQQQHCVFSKSALYGDTVYVHTQALDNGAWRQEVRQAGTNEVLVTNVLRGG